jgi:hypothetical protein
MHFPLRAIHILTILLVCSALIQFSAAEGDQQQQQASSEYTDDNDFRDTILNVTNTYRKQHNATALRWNQSLADGAEKWSKRCVFEHSVCLTAASPQHRKLTSMPGRSHRRKSLLRLRQRIRIHCSLGTRKSGL